MTFELHLCVATHLEEFFFEAFAPLPEFSGDSNVEIGVGENLLALLPEVKVSKLAPYTRTRTGMFVVDQREMFENSIWTRVPASSEQRVIIKTQVRQNFFGGGSGGGRICG